MFYQTFGQQLISDFIIQCFNELRHFSRIHSLITEFALTHGSNWF